MQERLRGYEPDNPLLLSTQYGEIAPNIARRWEIYEYTTNPIRIDDVFDELQLNGTERVMDIGCGDAHWIRHLSRERGHYGQMVGIDLYPKLMRDNAIEAQADQAYEVDFVAGRLEELPLPENSLDLTMAMYMLYHINSLEQGLSEIRRTLTPEGKLLVSTSGSINKSRHREFERKIAEYTGTTPPPVFASRFNSEIAEAVLPQWFDIETQLTQEDDYIRVDSGNSLKAYLSSLYTMRHAFDPVPTILRWNSALEKIVLPQIHDELHQDGAFLDPVRRDFFICRNRK